MYFLSYFISISQEQFLVHVFKILFFKIFHAKLGNFHSIEALLLIQKRLHSSTQEYQNKNVLKTPLKASLDLHTQLGSCDEQGPSRCLALGLSHTAVAP